MVLAFAAFRSQSALDSSDQLSVRVHFAIEDRFDEAVIDARNGLWTLRGACGAHFSPAIDAVHTLDRNSQTGRCSTAAQIDDERTRGGDDTMAITYSTDRQAYVDSESGEYMTERQVDRDYMHYDFALYRSDGTMVVGVETQQFLANPDRKNDERPLVQCFIRKAWKPDAKHTSHRAYLTETDPLIERITTFLVARRAHFSGNQDNSGFEVFVEFGPDKTWKEIYAHG